MKQIGVQNCPTPESPLFCRQIDRGRAEQGMLTVETIRKDSRELQLHGRGQPKVLEKVRSMPKEKQPAWISRAEEAVGNPDERDIQGLTDAVAEALKIL